MSSLPKSIQKLIDELARLPGIGPKTAGRLVFYLLTRPDQILASLGEAVTNLRSGLVSCESCFNIAESAPCSICEDQNRNVNLLMVVEEPLDVVALEKSGWPGRYHVLGGVISPINSIGPNELRIKELFSRLTDNKEIDELVLGTDPSLEGEATALYIEQQLGRLAESSPRLKKIKTTRLARGLPIGGELEYADPLTLKRAIEGRR